ncbi:AAA family ATPase [Pseudonocardia sediminis]|uniref:AAA family ATPase n=1 Tax=Pseudonocardia sediminis TaxID=1397368 RepID=UPI0013EF3C64|nr:AAA family ATPase [Pseudonocardia sediminis]
MKLLLVGDSRQLAAVGAGGALADVAARAGSYELAEVRRFTHEWEGPASLRLRDGDPTVIPEYVKNGRLVPGGTREQAETEAARLWLDSTLRGRDALLVVGSNAAAARTSQALRAELVRLGRVTETGVPLGRDGWEGTVAGVGDLVQARNNGWHLDGWEGNHTVPINRFTYRVTGIRPDGHGLVVARITGRDDAGDEILDQPIQLPGLYVAQNITLAYASTVHAAHGRTVDAGISVLGAGTDRATAYTQMTRGRDTNHAVVITRQVAEGADTGETFTVAPRDPAAVLADVIRPPEQDPNTTALAQAEAAADHDRHIATHVDPMLAVIADATAGRTGRWLDQLTADGTLPEQHRVALAADQARSSLDQLLRIAELAGHDPAHVLRDAITARPLDGSTSVAQVVHFRIRTALDGHLDPHVSTFADLLPCDLPEASLAGLQALADAADTRRIELGAQLAAQPPQWAREALGPVPDDPAGRAVWQDQAGRAAAYREWVGHDDPADPLSPAPAAGLVEKHALYRDAHAALDLPDAGADEEQASEGLLRARVAAWEREQRWAPRYVADELDATHEALRQRQTDATLYGAHADAATDSQEADQLRAAAAAARAEADQLAELIPKLEQADAARAAWTAETAVTRDKAERGRAALGLCGIDLDAPYEKVTAQEWIDAERAERLADDAHRPITEHDLRDHAHDELDHTRPAPADETHLDEPTADHSPEPPERQDRRRDHDLVAEPAPDDIREASTPDPGERADPEERRRVPLPDETDTTLDRAYIAVDEIEARYRAEAAHARDEDTAAEPEDDIRLDELHRWAGHDVTTVSSDDHADAVEDDDPVLDRGLPGE